jgi:hypothetical protein
MLVGFDKRPFPFSFFFYSHRSKSSITCTSSLISYRLYNKMRKERKKSHFRFHLGETISRPLALRFLGFNMSLVAHHRCRFLLPRARDHCFPHCVATPSPRRRRPAIVCSRKPLTLSCIPMRASVRSSQLHTTLDFDVVVPFLPFTRHFHTSF